MVVAKPIIRQLAATDYGDLICGTATVFRGGMEIDYPLLFRRDNLSNWTGAFVGDKLVAGLGVLRRTIVTPLGELPAALVGCVFTLPDYRQQGFASQLLTTALDELRGTGIELVLISGNRPLYHRFCAINTGAYLRAKFPVGHWKDSSLRLIPFSADLAPDLLRLYSGKPAYFLRSVDDFLRVVATGKAEDKPAKVYVMATNDCVAAYAVVREYGDTLEIVESAGDVNVIWKAIPQLARQSGATDVDWRGDSPDSELRNFLREREVEVYSEGFAGTILLLQPHRLQDRFVPWLESRFGSRQLALRITADDAKLLLTASDRRHEASVPCGLCALMFGASTEVGDPIEWLPAGLPLPLPRYGLDFV